MGLAKEREAFTEDFHGKTQLKQHHSQGWTINFMFGPQSLLWFSLSANSSFQKTNGENRTKANEVPERESPISKQIIL